MIKGVKVYVGCGDDTREGYVGVDIRETDAVEVVSKAWQISHYFEDLEEIYSRHMLEHLTFGELEFTLQDWLLALKPGGQLHIIVPNMTFHISQWMKIDWGAPDFSERKADAPWALAGFWGWQHECHPAKDDYNQSYWDVHKSGYSEESIRYFLNAAGFSNIKTTIVKECHLHATASR